MIWGWSRGSIFFLSEMFFTFSFRINVNKNKQKNYKPGMSGSVLDCVVLFFGEGHVRINCCESVSSKWKWELFLSYFPFLVFWLPKFSDGPSLLFKLILNIFISKEKKKWGGGQERDAIIFLQKSTFLSTTFFFLFFHFIHECELGKSIERKGKSYFSSLTKEFN